MLTIKPALTIATRIAVLVCLSIVLALLPTLAAATEYRFDNRDCPFADNDWFDPARMRCGMVIASEPGVAESLRIPAIHIRRNQEAAAGAASPVVFLNGGPGAPGVSEIDDWLAHPLLRQHDLILYDPRGTGEARPRLCAGLNGELLSLIARDLDADAEFAARKDRVRACVDSVSPALRGVFSTRHMANDLDAVRRMFGVAKVSLYAVSYGTRVAAAYADAYPQHVDRLALDSLVPADAYYHQISQTYTGALERAFAECASAPDCKARYPHLREDYFAIERALAVRPWRLRLPGAGYPGDSVVLNRQDFALLVQQSFYGDEFIPTFPMTIDALRRGDTAALGLLFEVTIGARLKGIDLATYYLVLGDDEVPLQSALPGLRPHGELVFFEQDLSLLESLGVFSGNVPSELHRHRGPTLMLAGRFDPITSPQYARSFAETIPRARFVEFSGGHAISFSDNCARDAVTLFLAGEAAPVCVATQPKVPWATHVYAGAWPRNWIEAMYLPRSLGQLSVFAALLLAYLGIAAWALLAAGLCFFRRLRSSPSDQPQARMCFPSKIGGAGFFAGLFLIVGLCAVVLLTAFGPTPGLLLFGLPAAAKSLLALALVFTLLTVLMLIDIVRSAIRRQWPVGRLWTVLAAFVNLGLVVFLLQWRVLIPT